MDLTEIACILDDDEDDMVRDPEAFASETSVGMPATKRAKRAEDGQEQSNCDDEVLSSTTWVRRLRKALPSPKRVQQRPVRVQSLCSGMATENYALQVLFATPLPTPRMEAKRKFFSDNLAQHQNRGVFWASPDISWKIFLCNPHCPSHRGIGSVCLHLGAGV